MHECRSTQRSLYCLVPRSTHYLFVQHCIDDVCSIFLMRNEEREGEIGSDKWGGLHAREQGGNGVMESAAMKA